MDERQGVEEVTAFSFYANYYEIAKKLTVEQQARFLMGICEYAFDYEVPDFSEDPLMDIAFEGIRPNIRRSADGNKHGKTGGRPRGKTKGKNPSDNPVKNPLENPSRKPIVKESIGEDSKVGKKNHPTDDDSSFPASDGAAAVKTAPTAAIPKCPQCDKAIRYDPRARAWVCPDCGKVGAAFEVYEVTS